MDRELNLFELPLEMCYCVPGSIGACAPCRDRLADKNAAWAKQFDAWREDGLDATRQLRKKSAHAEAYGMGEHDAHIKKQLYDHAYGKPVDDAAPVRQNMYTGTCAHCGQRVPEYQGLLMREGDHWIVMHPTCDARARGADSKTQVDEWLDRRLERVAANSRKMNRRREQLEWNSRQ